MKKDIDWKLIIKILIAQEKVLKDISKIKGKPILRMYKSIPNGCKIFEKILRKKNNEGKYIKIAICAMALKECKAIKRQNKIMADLRECNNNPEQLKDFFIKHGKYCSPIKII